MDDQTVGVYTQNAAKMAAAQRAIQGDTQVHRLMLQCFHAGGLTADIGCGSGRDVVWLTDQGFPTIGYEPSPGMRAEASAAYPAIDIREASLPELDTLPDSTFANVLCNAVLMHLPPTALPVALAQLARILQPGGRLVVSYRNSLTLGERERDGRLFANIDPALLRALLLGVGLQQIAAAEGPDGLRDGIVWRAAAAEKA